MPLERLLLPPVGMGNDRIPPTGNGNGGMLWAILSEPGEYAGGPVFELSALSLSSGGGSSQVPPPA